MLGLPTLWRLIAHERLGAEEGHDLGRAFRGLRFRGLGFRVCRRSKAAGAEVMQALQLQACKRYVELLNNYTVSTLSESGSAWCSAMSLKFTRPRRRSDQETTP